MTFTVFAFLTLAAPASARARQVVEKTIDGAEKANEWIITRVRARFVDEDLLKGEWVNRLTIGPKRKN